METDPAVEDRMRIRWRFILLLSIVLLVPYIEAAQPQPRVILTEKRYVTATSNCWGDLYEQALDEQHYSVTSAEQCQQHCDENPKCKSYIVDYATLSCSLYSSIGGAHHWESAECGCKREYCDSPYQLQSETNHIKKKTITYSWHSSNWTSCSRTCGRGIRTRDVTCYSSLGHAVDMALCPIQKRPKAELICESAPCSYLSISKNCHAPEWEHALNHHTAQKEEVHTLKECQMKCDRHHLCRSAVFVSHRSALSCALFSTLGGSRPWPYATCSCKHTDCDDTDLMTTQHEDHIYESYATSHTPHDGEQLNSAKISWDMITYEIIPSEWNECSNQCGTHLQTRELICRSSRGRDVPLDMCTTYSTKRTKGTWTILPFPETNQTCYNGPCEYLSSHGSQCYGPRLSDGIRRHDITSERACQHECDIMPGCISLMWLPKDGISTCILFDVVGGEYTWPTRARCACKSEYCSIKEMTTVR